MDVRLLSVEPVTAKMLSVPGYRELREKMDAECLVRVTFRVADGAMAHDVSIMVDTTGVDVAGVVQAAWANALKVCRHIAELSASDGKADR